MFEKGIFANSMDEKWDVFVLDNFIYLARSWTNHCIYKIRFIKQAENVILEKGFVTRNKKHYNSNNIEQDKVFFLKILQFYLQRDDIYVDPAFQFDLIKQIISQYEPDSRYKKSTGKQSVRINKVLYQGFLHYGQEYVDKTGWSEFYNKIKDMNDDINIISLYLHGKEANRGTTFYFDEGCKILLAKIVPVD